MNRLFPSRPVLISLDPHSGHARGSPFAISSERHPPPFTGRYRWMPEKLAVNNCSPRLSHATGAMLCRIPRGSSVSSVRFHSPGR